MTEYVYDSIGNVIKEISPKGAVTEYEYDKHDIVTKIKDALGNETKYETDLNGMTTKIIQANGGEYTYNYDAVQRLTGLKTPNGYEKTFTYDKRGDIVSEKDNLDRESKYSYDISHRVKEMTDPKGGVTAFDYDKNGNIISVLEANGATSTFTYDLLDRVTQDTDAEGKKTTYEYDKVGNITKVIKPGERTTSFKYDNNYNLTEITDPLGEKVKAVYDKNDRVVRTTDELGNTYKYTYDKEDQVTSVIDPTGEKVSLEYDAHGNVSSIGNQLGAKQKYSYDLNDNLTKVTDPLGRETKYEYDEMDNLTKITDSAGKVSTFTYDLEGNLTSYTDAGGKTDVLVYDVAGNLKSRTRPDGKKVSYDYDKLNDLTEKEYSENGTKVLYLYDEMGNRTQMTDASGDSTYTYDLMNRITSVISSDGRTVKYTYDEADNLESITYPDGRVVSYEYDLNDRLIKVTDGELITTYTYDAAGRVTETKRPDGSSSSYEYNERDEIVSLENKSGDDKVLSSFSYEYDATGNIVKEEATDDLGKAIRTYEYNEADELTGFTEKSDTSDLEYRYEYDETGNRTLLEIKGRNNGESVSETIKYEYNEEGLLISETSSLSGTTLYEYDGNGNLLKKIGGDKELSYEYTVESRLKAVREGGELLMAAGYDGDGNRILQVTRNERSFEVTNPLEKEVPEEDGKDDSDTERSSSLHDNNSSESEGGKKSGAGKTKTPFTGDNNWYLEAFLFGTWQGTVNNLAVFNSSLAVNYTEQLREEWDDNYHGRIYNEEVGDISYSKEDLTALENAELSDEDIETIKSQEIVEEELADEEKITIPGATYEVSERYYDLTRYVNDVNTDNTEVLQEYTGNGNLKSTHVYGNERVYSDVFNPVTDAYNTSIYNYDGRGSVVQNIISGNVATGYRYDPFGVLTSGEPESASYYGYNAEETNTLTGLQYLRARYYDTGDGRFITADDYLGDTQDPLTLNRYAYTANNPVRYNDPSGHFFNLIKNTLKTTTKLIGKTVNTFKNIKNKLVKATTSTMGATVSLISPSLGRTIYNVGNSLANILNNKNRNSNAYANYNSLNNYRKNNRGFTSSIIGASVGTYSAKQKKNNFQKKTYIPIFQTFVNMMGASVQLAVGSAQTKKRIDLIKKKVISFYCGKSRKIDNQYSGKQTPTVENVRNDYKYKVEKSNKVNGIGINGDTIIIGNNATYQDAILISWLKHIESSNKSTREELKLIDDYKRKNSNTVISLNKKSDYYEIEDITKRLTQTMIQAEYENTSTESDAGMNTYSKVFNVNSLIEFKNKVGNKKVWDLKQYEEWNTSSMYIFDGEIVDSDAPGNIMYGYMGKAYGIPDDVLYLGAGAAQIISGNSRKEFIYSNFDDPIDQVNIKRGIEYYNKIHR